MRQLIAPGLNIIEESEALRFYAYPDPGSPLAKQTKHLKLRWGFKPARTILSELGSTNPLTRLSGTPWTCGYGHTKGVTLDTTCDKAQAERWLDEDCDEAQEAVERLVHVDLDDFEYAALVSLVFNIGEGNFAKSTLLKLLNQGKRMEAAARFTDFVNTYDQVTKQKTFMEGLYIRRQKERVLFMSNRHAEEPMMSNKVIETAPDRVKSVANDPNMTAPIATGVATTGAALAEAAQKIEPLAMYSETIKTIFIVLSVLGIALTIYLRMKRRGEP